jgi:hypothetical protein
MAAPFKHCALLDRKRHVVDVASNFGCRLKSNVLRADDAGDFAAYDDLLARDHTGQLALLPYDDLSRLHIALDLAIDLQGAAADDFEPLPNDLEIVADLC